MTETINTTLGTSIYVHPNPVVAIADALQESEFEDVPYLRCTRLRDAVAPEISHAQLTYEYGRIFREDGAPVAPYEPLDIAGKFVRVTIPATVDGEDDVVWYGKIATNSREHHGTGDNGDTLTGIQVFGAFGVLWLLDQQPILKTFIDEGLADPLEIPEGLVFDSDHAGSLPGRGNRSSALFDNTVGDGQHFVFSDKARGAENWNAYEATLYILERLAPTDAGGTAVNQWLLADGIVSLLFDWYEIAVQTHGRTVKQVLDELIPRHRGLGYYAAFDPTDDTCRIHVFTFADADITLPSGSTLKANPDLRALDFDQAFDVEVQVADVNAGQFNRIVCEGEKRTTTFTQPFTTGLSTDFFERDWQPSEEQEYAEGASGESWYAALDEQSKQFVNAASRANQKLRHVFTRFRMQKSGDTYRNRPFLQMYNGQNATGDIKSYWFAPDLNADDFDPLAPDPFPDRDGYLGNPVWVNGVRFLRELPLFDRYDYSGTNIEGGEASWKAGVSDLQDLYDQPDYMKPFAFARLSQGANTDEDRYVPLDRMHETAFATDNGRTWSVGLNISTTDPSVMLTTHPNHFIANDIWEDLSPAATSQEQTPSINGGLSPEEIWVTITAEIPERVRKEKTVVAPAVGAPESVLRIDVPDCRVDWVCPYTTVEIRNGQMVKTTSGGFVRDDRDRLADIAESAAEWYGRTRQTLTLTYKTLRNLFHLGWLITEFGSFQKTDVNTVITAIDYNLGRGREPGTVTIETSYAQLDFQ